MTMSKTLKKSEFPKKTLTLLGADGSVLARRTIPCGSPTPPDVVRNGGIGLNLARVSTNGQITVPAEIRRALKIREGDKILFYQKPNGEIVINNTSLVSISEADRMYGSSAANDDASEMGSRVS